MIVYNTYFVYENKGAYALEIEYEYYWKDETYEDPFEDDLHIEKVELNGIDITTFYTDFLCDIFHEEVWEHAINNKYK